MKVCLFTFVLLSNLATFAITAAPARAANPIKSSIDLQSETDRATLKSQQRIDQISDQTRELLQEYRQATRELESLRDYNDHLERMVAAQRQSISSFETQLDEVQVTQREIIPLLGRMVDTLAQFVELDRPFLFEERRQRVEQLRALLDRPDSSVAEKYRRVMEAYQIETDYGRSIEAYRGVLQHAGGERTVEFLRVGRIGLFYRSLDGIQAGSWDPASRSWHALSDEYRGTLKQAFAVARKQSAPELLILPFPAPQVTQ